MLHEAHEAAIKLQKHSLDSSESYERTRELESENARLKEEIAILRANPDDTSDGQPFQLQELTLAHRRLSDQLGITEATLELRTTELTNAQTSLSKAYADAEGAMALTSRIRVREEEGLLRERELRHKVRVAEEERKMADLVVSEYADLVRTLEGRTSALPPKPPPKDGSPGDENGNVHTRPQALVDSYSEGKKGLQTLLREFSVEAERLEARIARLEHELALAELNCESERKASARDRALLAKVQAELVKIRVDDKAAARMVARYMEFSQTSTNTLQTTISSLKTRHAATLQTSNLESEHLQIALKASQRHGQKLQEVLDSLSADIARETYGRRREVSLRLALLLREARVAEGLQRWSGKAREMLYRAQQRAEIKGLEEAFERSVEGAEGLLKMLNGDGGVGSNDREEAVVGRIIAAQSAVEELNEELRVETGRRMNLERQRALERLTTSKPSNGGAIAQPSAATNGKTVEPNGIGSHSPLPLPKISEASAHEDASAPAHDTSPMEAAADIASSLNQDIDGPTVITEPPIHTIDYVTAHDSTLTEATSDVTPRTSSPTLGEQLSVNIEDTPARHFVPAADVVHQPRPRSIEEATFIYDPPRSSLDSLLTASTSNTDIFAAQPNSSPLATIASSPPPALHPQRHPLLADLDATKHRYDELQRAFRECHQTLKNLQDSIENVSGASGIVILKTATQRLDDFNEDVRVEVEIRIADEELTIKGYETLLTIPGALADDAEQDAVEGRIKAFVDGSEKSVAKAMQQFNRKLDDLQHDVASIKLALHELPEETEPAHHPSPPPTPGWGSWTSLLGAAPRPVSPAPPTFGTVMTTPRLRHSSSFTKPQTPGPGRKSSISIHDPNPNTRVSSDPYASLGLRIPMPSHTPSSLGFGTPPRSTPRPRNLSTMYMLGLGSRSSSLNITANETPTKAKTSSMHMSQLGDEGVSTDPETDLETDDEPQTDVE
ncbi:hypothetical protein HWV62_44913 [Athelia sp. TMB]|nr:hypothetical protein HWV62_44913 [Athelia sp. TMB]